jgi:hypothetical protein
LILRVLHGKRNIKRILNRYLGEVVSASPAVDLLSQLVRVRGFQLRMRLSEPDQVQFVLLAFAQPSPWIAVGPELALRDVFQTGDSHTDSQNLGLHGPGQKYLVPFVRGELNPKFAFEALLLEMRGEPGTTSSDDHDLGVKRIYWLNITIDS